MSPNQIFEQSKTKFQYAIHHFQEELKKLRTGRAHPSMLDSITVTAYGTAMPLNQVGTVTAPEAQLLQISPFDPGNIQAIAQAIRDNPSLGLNPIDDGRVVRIQIPALTTERREQIVKLLHEKVEECMIALRAIRHDALKEADQSKKDKQMSEDDHHRLAKQIEDHMAKLKAEVDSLAKAREKEIMTV